MGKGDKKSRRGKIHIGSHGTRRPRKTVPVIPVSTTAEKPVKVADVR
ncbi:MAG: 30S ribosomal protein THX [Bacteroidales bacterium]|nr:30S ribosomal protein THX [Bacteroidales bacterium]